MRERSFVTCFDKDCEMYAEVLMTLISENESICNINIKKEEFKKDRKVTSGEYVLTIGPEGSKVNKTNFPDCYDKYGIHIGFRGRKAWICCEDYSWNEQNLKAFQTDLIQLLDEHGMRTDNINEEIAEYIKKVKQSKTMDVVRDSSLSYAIIMTSIMTASIMASTIAGPIGFLYMFKRWIRNYLRKSKIREQQYKLAVVMFYHKYINEFLNISTSTEDVDKDNGMNFRYART